MASGDRPLATIVCLALAAVLALVAIVTKRPADEARPWRLGVAAWAVLAASLFAALWPPAGPMVWGAAAGGVLAILALWCGNPLLTAALAAATATGIGLCDPDLGLALAGGLAVGSWLAVWAAALPGLLEGRPLLREASVVAGLLTVSAVAAAFGRQGWSVPAASAGPGFLLAIGFALAIVGARRERLDGRRVTAFLVLTVLLGGAVAWALDIGWPPLLALSLGLIAGLLLESLPEPPPTDDPEWWPVCLRDGLLAAVIVGATGVVSFQLSRGLGLALATVGVCACGGLVRTDDRLQPRELDPGALGITALTVWVLFRLIYERVSLDAGRADLYLHTTMIGLLAGLLGPLAVGLAVTPARRGARDLEVGLATLVGLALPAGLTVALWGQRAAVTTIAGAMAGNLLLLALLPALRSLPAPAVRWLAALPAAYATMAALAVAETVALAPLSRSSLVVKTAVLLGVMVATAFYLSWRARPVQPGPVEN